MKHEILNRKELQRRQGNEMFHVLTSEGAHTDRLRSRILEK